MFQKQISVGIKYLVSQQQKNGSFLSLTSTNLHQFSSPSVHHAIVPSNIVLSSLNSLDETGEILKIKQKVADFLLTQVSDHWSINYWIRNSKDAKATPYPDDLDDTFCALAALYQYNPDLFDGNVMAKIVTILTAAEEEVGGPYDMWLVSPEAKSTWNRIDLVVNSNVAYFLSFQDISMPKVNDFIEKSIDEKDYVFPYCSIYPAIYFISRFYGGKKTKQMVELLLSKCDDGGSWKNPLYTALAISSLLNFSPTPTTLKKLKKSVDYLISTQSSGGWKPYSFYVELKTKQKTYYSGSSSLTTALCLEALAKYQSQLNNHQQPKEEKKINSQGKRVHQQATKQAKDNFSQLDTDLQKLILQQFTKILKTDKVQPIILLPFLFKESLGAAGKEIEDGLLVKLGLANLYGWIAYTIYDDFLDDEGEPKFLSVANVCLRELTVIYSSILPKKSELTSFFKQVMDRLDAANAWEVSQCRFKNSANKLQVEKLITLKIPDYEDYSRLSERSLGHSLGPVAILFALGHQASHSEVENLMKFFKHYLIARQLNDDAHDWEHDFKMGHINAVGAEILKKLQETSHKVGDATQLLQEIFWHEVVVDVCDEVLRHVEKANSFIKKIPSLSDTVIFEKILAPVEKSAQKALKERERTIDFLRTYRE